MSMIRDGKGEVITPENPLNTKTTTEDVIAVDIQARMTQLIQTQAGVTILPNAWNQSAWHDSHVDGSPLTYLGVTTNMVSGTGMTLAIDFSHDGVNGFSGSPTSIYDGTNGSYSTFTDVQLPARYFRIAIKNKDATNPKTTTAYSLLKA